MRMVDAVGEGRVLTGTDQERLHRLGLAIHVLIGLRETGRIGREARLSAVGVNPVDARQSAILIVERVVLVENHEDILNFFTQVANEFFSLTLIPYPVAGFLMQMRGHIGSRIWLDRH